MLEFFEMNIEVGILLAIGMAIGSLVVIVLYTMAEKVGKYLKKDTYLSIFQSEIEKFNKMYKLPISKRRISYIKNRVHNFRDILLEEVRESDIIVKDECRNGIPEIDLLVSLSDWLGDMVVYIFSEALKFGIPLDKVLEAIMKSNFSKLDEKGNPIYDERGKVLKGLNYKPPEEEIKKILLSIQGDFNEKE